MARSTIFWAESVKRANILDCVVQCAFQRTSCTDSFAALLLSASLSCQPVNGVEVRAVAAPPVLRIHTAILRWKENHHRLWKLKTSTQGQIQAKQRNKWEKLIRWAPIHLAWQHQKSPLMKQASNRGNIFETHLTNRGFVGSYIEKSGEAIKKQTTQ